jgi:hypothetical protein
VYWVFSYDILTRLYQQGLETGIAAFFVVLLVYKLLEFERSWQDGIVTRRQLITLGAVAALAVFSRLDLVFLAGIVGIWIVFRGHLLRYFLPLDVVATFVSILLSFVLRLSLDSYYQYSSAATVMIAMSLVVNPLCAYIFGLYQRTVIYNPLQLLRRLVLFTAVISAVSGSLIIALNGMGVFDGFPRTVIFINALLSFILFGGIRFLYIGLRTGQPDPQTDDHPMHALRAHWRKWLNDGVAYFGVAFGALGIYMLWNRIAFGTFSPVSGQIKRWWGSLDGLVYGGSAQTNLTFFGIDYYGDGNAWHPVSTLFGNWAETTPYKFGIVDTWRYLVILSVFAIVFYLVLLINKRKAKNAIAEMSIIVSVRAEACCHYWNQIHAPETSIRCNPAALDGVKPISVGRAVCLPPCAGGMCCTNLSARLSPLYMSITGAGWVSGEPCSCGHMGGKRWAYLAVPGIRFVWLAGYWVERLFFQAAEGQSALYDRCLCCFMM